MFALVRVSYTALVVRYSLEDEFKPDVLSTALNNLGSIYMKNETTLLQARHYLTQSIKVDPDRYSSHANLGEVLSKLGLLDLAIVHYQRANSFRENPDVHNNWGIAIYQRSVNMDSRGRPVKRSRAEQQQAGDAVLADVFWHYKRATELDSTHTNAHHNAGKVLYHQQNWDEAIRYFGRCVELDKANGLFAYDYALALLRRGATGDKARATKYLQRALESKDPNVDPNRVRHNLQVATQPN